MRKLAISDLEKLRIGSAILGSGGGGDPSELFLMAKYLIDKRGPVDLISLEDLPDNGIIVPLAMVGVPLVIKEKIPNGNEFSTIIDQILSTYSSPISAVMPIEIGGANAFAPIIAAAQKRLPILDADLIGRAFPELQMNSAHLTKAPLSNAIIADSMGNVEVIKEDNIFDLEDKAREATIRMGSLSHMGFYFMSKDQAQKSVIKNSISQALQYGHEILSAREKGLDCINEFLKNSSTQLLATGVINTIKHEIDKGFLKGEVGIASKKGFLKVIFKNEYLLVQDADKKAIATTPNLIVILDSNTGEPITSENLKYGLSVALFVIEAPDIWKSNAGLKLVGPEKFEYSCSYLPLTRKGRI